MAKEKIVELDPKDVALQKVMQNLNKKYGAGTVMTMNDAAIDIKRFNSGCLSLDNILGGGYPVGRIIEIYGPESSGKTTLALHAVASVQKNGGRAAYIDVENALDPVYAKAIGVDISSLVITQPSCGEDALDIAEALVASNAFDIIVVDSVAALTPRAELEGEMGDQQMGLQARLMSKGLRKLTGIMNQNGCTGIFINQLRQKIGVMYGNPETTAGGQALKYYASIRLDIRKVEALKKGKDIYGNRVRVKSVKNKVAPPLRTVEFDIVYGEGISYLGDIIDTALNLDIIERSGAWYTIPESVNYPDSHRVNGKEKIKEIFEKYPDSVEGLVTLIKEYYENNADALLDTGRNDEEDEAPVVAEEE